MRGDSRAGVGMEATIIVPRDMERVLEFDLPEPLLECLATIEGRCGLTIQYLSGNRPIVAATHDFAPAGGKSRLARLRKRLPPPPLDLRALRLTLTSVDECAYTATVEWPAAAPDLADFARGALSFDDLPDELTPGCIARLPVTLTNSSDYLWEPGSAGVALRIDLNGDIQHMSLPCAVPPGEERSFELALPLPATSGPWNLSCAPALAPALPFARGRTFRPARETLMAVSVAAVAQPPAPTSDRPRCRIIVGCPTPRLLAGEPAVLAVTLTNTGATRIEASGTGSLRLRARWRREPRQGMPIRDEASSLLPLPLEPGETCIVALDATAPDPGGYSIDIVAELVGQRDRLDRDHCDCPPLSIDVVGADLLEKAEERALRGELSATQASITRAAYRDWAARCDTFANAADCAARTGLHDWPSHPSVALILTGDVSDADALAAAEWTGRQFYPHAMLLRAGDPLIATADLLVPWSPRAGRLADHALVFLAGEFVRDPSLGYVSADLDDHDGAGARHGRIFLPERDAFFARAQPATGSVFAVRPAFLKSAGAILDQPDLAARLIAHSPGRTAHIPHVLFHRKAKPAVYLAHANAPVAAGRQSVMKQHDAPGFAVRAILPEPAPSVAIIIPTRDRFDLLSALIGSILERTDYPAFELIVVDNGSEEPETLAYLDWLQSQGIARVLRDDGDFNWSRLNNRAAATTRADILCFLNNDMEVLAEGWLTELAALAAQQDVGVAGATLWFENGTVQHAGVAFSAGGIPMHLFRGAPRGAAPFYLRSLRIQPAVTGACQAVRRSIFEQVGGFDEQFPLGFNDIDFCMRVRESLDLPSVCTPAVDLLHKESASRGSLRGDADQARFQRDLAWFEGRHLETARHDSTSRVVAETGRKGAPLTMVARRPQGAIAAARRYRRLSARPVAFLHIPKTAGSACREVLERALPDRAVVSLGARANVEGHAGDPATAARLAPLLLGAEVLFSHISHGFGEAVGWACDYATILRDPTERVRSHHGFLIAPMNAPLRDTSLADWSVGEMLRKGVIPGNLMLSKILGEPPELVGWRAIDGRFPRYAGFRLPPALWHGDMDALASLPDVAPDLDEDKVARALAIIERDFVFVGLQERLDEHLPRFGAMLEIPAIGSVPHVNVSRTVDQLDPNDRAMIERYNALDRLLYDKIASRPGGLFVRS